MTYKQASNEAIRIVSNTDKPLRVAVIQYPSRDYDAFVLYNTEPLPYMPKCQILAIYLSKAMHSRYLGGL